MLIKISFFVLFTAGSLIPGSLEVQYNKTLFTFFSFITLNKFSEEDTLKLNSTQKYVMNYLHNKIEDSYKQDLKSEFNRYNNHMFEYWLTMLALNCSQPPEIRSMVDELQTYNSENNIKYSIGELRNLEQLLPVMNEFYSAAEINILFEECRGWYDSAYTVYYNGTMNEIRNVLEFIKMDERVFFEMMDKIVIVPNLIGPRGSAMGPQFMGIKYDVQSPYEDYLSEINITPHEYIHDMVKHLTKSEEYQERILIITEKVWEQAAGSDAVRYYNDKILWFDECLVRTLDYATSIKDEEKLRFSLEKTQAAKGFLLVLPMVELIKEYEKKELSFDEYFAEFLNRLM
jgi:hypothetical protein